MSEICRVLVKPPFFYTENFWGPTENLIKNLGLHLDNMVNWKSHINKAAHFKLLHLKHGPLISMLL